MKRKPSVRITSQSGVVTQTLSGPGEQPQRIAKHTQIGITIDVETSEVKDHAEFSASGSARWLNCPGSIALSKLAPPAPESRYAAEGTQAHACLEFLLKNRTREKTNGKWFVPTGAVNMAYETYPSEMVEHGLSAATYLLDRLKAAGPDAEFLCETRVDASPFTCTGQFGTLDAAIVAEFDRLIVADYKYGAGIAVDPDEGWRGNSQLVYYALGISHMYHHNFSEVELVVIQPRARHESGETIRSFVMPMPDLLAWINVFREGVMATGPKDAPVIAGKWCKFCNAATICPELKTKAMRAAEIVFDDDKPVAAMVLPPPALAQIPKLGKMLEACDKLEAWIAKVRDHAFHVLEHGGEIDGFKLVEKRAQRKWKDREDAEISAASAPWSRYAFTEPKLLTPAQLEKAVPEAKAFVKAHTVKESSGLTMVGDDDKRPAVRRLEQIFDELPSLDEPPLW